MTVYAGPRFTVEPFPPLRWTGALWEGNVAPPAWRDFAARTGPSARGRRSPDGAVILSIAPPHGAERAEPSLPQAEAYRYLLAHDAMLRDNILRAIYFGYPALQSDYGYGPAESAERMPDLAAPDDLHDLVGLSTIHLFNTSWDGAAYVGFAFDCSWDEEHGLGVLTHRSRMVEVGGAEVAFEERLAKVDLDS